MYYYYIVFLPPPPLSLSFCPPLLPLPLFSSCHHHKSILPFFSHPIHVTFSSPIFHQPLSFPLASIHLFHCLTHFFLILSSLTLFILSQTNLPRYASLFCIYTLPSLSISLPHPLAIPLGRRCGHGRCTCTPLSRC